MTDDVRYFEDFEVGFEFGSAGTTLTDAKVELFASVSQDHHPIHHDVVYAAEHGLGAPVVHGLLLTSLMALGASDISASLRGSVVAMLWQRTDFRKPAFVGTTVRPWFRVAQLEGKSTAGLVVLDVRIEDQNGEVLADGQQAYLMRYRDHQRAEETPT
ncbi:MAG: MaoC family dehydratase [Nocardioidaceae bacterium]